MKTMKKLASLALALILALALAVPAMAAGETYNLTLPTNEVGNVQHSYEVYQIFTGDVSGTSGAYVLSNVKWGANGTGALGAAVDETILTAIANVAGKTDAEKLAVINSYASLTSTPYKTGISGEVLSVEGGYYLIKDANDSLDGKEGVAYTTYLVKVVGPTTLTAKSEVPSLTKSVEEAANQWQESADREIGKEVRFKLTATVPADVDFSAYETYKLVFNDTMSAGITFDSIDSVTVTGKNATSDVVTGAITDYTCTAEKDQAGGSWTLTITDLKTAVANLDITKGVTVEVIYKAHLNESAVVGSTGNDNTANLNYSNNPSDSGSGHTPEGKTPDDKAIVFTYELDVTKVDGTNPTQKLEDAEFILYNANNEYAIVYSDGKVTGWTTTESDAITLKSDANGFFKVAGLDDGTYYLKETKAPTGYNLLKEPIEIVIDAATTATGITSLTITVDNGDEDKTNDTVDGNTTTGVVATTVKNNAGATLPETGGIGTTIFYAVGGVLVVAAIVLLVTKKRMNREG